MKKIVLNFDDDGYFVDCDLGDFNLNYVALKDTQYEYYKMFMGNECVGYFSNSHRPECYDKDGKLVCQNNHVRLTLFPKMENRIELRKNKVKT